MEKEAHKKVDGRTIRGLRLKSFNESVIKLAAVELAWRAERVSFSSLAAETGLSEPSVRNHYTTMQELFDSCAELFLDRILPLSKKRTAEDIVRIFAGPMSNGHNLMHLLYAFTQPAGDMTVFADRLVANYEVSVEEATDLSRETIALLLEEFSASRIDS